MTHYFVHASKRATVLTMAATVGLFLLGPWLAEAATSFQVSVPNKPNPMQITKLQMHVDVGMTNPMDPVTFTVTDPEGTAHAFGPLTPGAGVVIQDYAVADGASIPDYSAVRSIARE